MGFNTVINYFVKAGKSIPIHSTLTRLDDIVFEYTDDVYGLIKGNQITKLKNAGAKLQPTQELRATIGDASVWIESHLLDAFPAASQEVKSAFRGLSSVQETMHRPKGALSIFPKVQRGLIEAAEKGRDFSSIKEAIRYVDDGIGSRVITRSLDKLSRSQIDDMIRNTMIDGKRISAQDMKILRGYIYSANPEKCSPRAFQLYEQFAQPLIEKRSGEVVDRLTAGILKHRVLNEGLDLQDLCRRGLLDEKWLKIIESNDVLPLNITQINNYRGAHGLPEFTNRQIQQLSRALNTGRGRSLKVLSDVRGLDDFLYSADEVAELSKKSIKTSGYRTAQVKIVHANGALGEIQYRGRLTNMIGEYEHIAYDLRQGKNTLGPLFDDFATAVSSLSPEEYAKYNKYLEECYNYYNRIELGLPAIKPNLPRGFSKVLSEDSMRMLHEQAEELARIESKGFYRHLAEVI